MAGEAGRQAKRPPLRPLLKQEIDRRIERLVSEIASLGESAEAGAEERSGSLDPRWIHAADLVERMRRFVVHN